jgi:hypothetical protein
VAVNKEPINVPFGAFGSTTYPAFTFAEAAIDATNLLGLLSTTEDECGNILSRIFKSVWIKSKSATGPNASFIDFVEPFSLPENLTAAVAVNYFYYDVVRAQLTTTVSPGLISDYNFNWSPGGAIINGTINTSVTGTLDNYNIDNPIFAPDPNYICVPYIWNVTITRKSDLCQVGKARVILQPPCIRIGKPINPEARSKKPEDVGEGATLNREVQVYPNPSKGHVTIVLPNENGSNNIDLIDMTGAIVRRWHRVTTNSIQFRNLQSGLYLLKVTSNATGKITMRKIIVNN